MRPTRSMGSPELAQALDAGIGYQQTDNGHEAGTRLLIAHQTWLSRDELRRHIGIAISRSGLIAWIDWDDLAAEPDQSPASTSERAILRLACSLAGSLPDSADRPWSLLAMLSSLDIANALLASRAVAMAAIGPGAVGTLT